MEPLPKALFLDEDNSVDVVVRRLSGTSPALRPVIEHIHQAVKQVRPTQAQWRELIGLLTEIGQASDARRQEWVLLSDLLGLSTLIEDINTPRPKGATRNTIRGPFYRPGARRLPNGASISLDGRGTPLAVFGRVVDLDHRPVADAEVECWQANGDGLYENQHPDRQPDFNLRGRFLTEANGTFHYLSVKPAGYRVPDDGPVGQLLSRLDFSLQRPAHIHFQITAPGFDTLTTQVYDGSDPHLQADALFAVKPDLIGQFRKVAGDEWRLDFTFVLARARKDQPR